MRISKDVYKVATDLISKQFKGKTIKVMKPLHAGYTNFSYYLELNDGSCWQVRIPHDKNLINRKTEHGVLKLVNNDHFFYFDEKTGTAIKKWIVAKTPGFFNIRNKNFCYKLLDEIKSIHKTKIPKSFPIKNIQMDAYNENLYKLKFIYQKKFLCILDRHRDDKFVLNHTDINPDNILLTKNKKVILIDYEWAALASDYWDYANFIRESGIQYRIVDWSKYIENFDIKYLREYIYLSCVYAYLWTYAMPQTKKILKYRNKTYKQIKKYYRGVVNVDQDEIKPL